MSHSGRAVRRSVLVASMLLVPIASCGKKQDAHERARADQVQILDTHETSDPVSGDEAVLAQLQHAGADLSKPTHVIHHVYFASAEGAEAARRRLRDPYTGSVEPSEQQFLLSVEHHVVPSLANIGAAREELEKLAVDHGGDYDGWEAAVTK